MSKTSFKQYEAESSLLGLLDGLLILNKRLKASGLLNDLIQDEIDDIWNNNEYRTIIKEEKLKTEGVTTNG